MLVWVIVEKTCIDICQTDAHLLHDYCCWED